MLGSLSLNGQGSSASHDAVDLDVDDGSEDLTLSALLQQSMSTSQSLLSHSTDYSLAATQAALTRTLASLSLCASLVARLALLSSNEGLDELSTPTLRCFLVPFYTGSLELQRRTKDYKARIEVLGTAKKALEGFVRTCDDYEVVDREKRKRLFMLGGSTADPARRREAKIAQYKEEKALKAQIDEMNDRLAAKSKASISSGSARATTTASSIDDALADADEHLRPLLLTQIAHAYMQAHNELASIGTELELLRGLPNMSELPSARSADNREKSRQDEREGDDWRLDRVPPSLGGPADGPRSLVDSSGRILRPFTILPSSSSSSANSLDTRLRLQSQVFGPSHRLPSMSIDEYLDLEAERGNILQGGGAKNTEESKQEAADKKAWEEEEDNLEGYRRAEEKRKKDVEWDEYKDDHKKGEGNRMNRG